MRRRTGPPPTTRSCIATDRSGIRGLSDGALPLGPSNCLSAVQCRLCGAAASSVGGKKNPAKDAECQEHPCPCARPESSDEGLLVDDDAQPEHTLLQVREICRHHKGVVPRGERRRNNPILVRIAQSISVDCPQRNWIGEHCGADGCRGGESSRNDRNNIATSHIEAALTGEHDLFPVRGEATHFERCISEAHPDR